MTVHFIGAGPGAADLITVRGRDLIARCPVCLFAGSIVPRELLAYCPADARIVDTAPMTLDQIEAEFVTAHASGLDVARLHSGDLSIYSAVAEQMRRLTRHGIPYTLVPGVPAFAAAAATLGCELTVPELAQSVVLTRMPGRASAMPETERLASFAATGATLAIHLAITSIDRIVSELTPFYGGDCPVAMSDVHFLILGMRTGKTACSLPIYAFYPQTETAHVGKRSVPGADGAPINYTSTAFRSPAKRVAAYWIRKLIFGGQLKSTPMMASERREIKRRTCQLV